MVEFVSIEFMQSTISQIIAQKIIPMISTKSIIKSLSFAFILLIANSGFSQLVANGAYLMGDFVEVGIHNNGNEGTWDLAGSNSRTTSTQPEVFFGFVANPQMDNWANYDGDFFTPGTPENGFGLEINGTNYSNNGNNPTMWGTPQNDIPGVLSNYQVIGDCISVDWDGTINNVDVHIVYRLTTTNLFYSTEVTLTNNTGGDLTDVYYYRNVDPDNNVTINGGTYSTQNTVVSQPTGTCEKALVSAEQTNPWDSYMGFGALGAQFRVSYGGFANRDGSDIWNGTGGLTGTVASTTNMDEAISLAYKIENFTAGSSETFQFVVILDENQIDLAINSLFYFDYAGGLAGPTSECEPISDTVETCSGLPVTISIDGPNVNDYTWSWDPPTDLSTTTGPTTDASPSTTTTYTLTGVPSNPCLTSNIEKIIVVDVSAGPDLLITDPGPQCGVFDLTTLVLTDLNATPGTTVTFHSMPPDSATDMSNLWPTTTMVSTDVVYVMIADPTFGCYDFEQIILNWGGGFSAGLDSTNNICNDAGVTADLNTYLTVGVTGGTWTETSASGQFNATTGVFDASGLTPATYTFTYVVPGAAPCPNDTADFTLIVLGSGTAGADNATSMCNGTGTFDVSTLLSGADAGGDWLETTAVPSGQFDPLTALFDITGLPVGTYTFTYTIIGCLVDDIADFTVTIGAIDAGLDNTSSLCNSAGTTIDLNTLLTVGVAGGNWEETTGSGQLDAPNGIFDASGLAAANYNFLYVIIGAAPCVNDTAEFDIQVEQELTAGDDNTSTICNSAGNTVDLTLLLANQDAGGVWSETSGSGQFNTGTGIFDVNALGAGNYTFEYTVTAIAPCPVDVSDFTVTVNPDPIINAGTDLDICEGDAVTLSATGAIGGAYVWDNGVTDGSSFNPTTLGITNYTVNATDVNGCTGSDMMSITVNEIPTPSLMADTLIGCSPFEVEFTSFSNPASVLCEWDFGDGNSTTGCGQITNTFMNEGLYDITLTVTTNAGCSNTVVMDDYIEVDGTPFASFSYNPDISTIEDTEVEFTNSSFEGETYYWSFGDNTPTSTVESPTHVFPETGNQSYAVTMIVYNSIGCSDTMTQIITIQDIILFYIPNIFTPDGDDYNETFKPIFYSGHDPYDFHMVIYNRWGEIVFESYNANAAWDGTYGDGGLVEDGVYIWSLDFKETMSDKRHYHNGHITVLK